MSGQVAVQKLSYAAPAVTRVLRTRAMVIAVLFGIATVIGFVIEPRQALHSWLLGFSLTLGATLGCLGVLMLWHLSGGHWGVPLRRIVEAGTRNIWLVTAYFIPILIGIKQIYPWMNEEELRDAHEKALHHQYLNFEYFLIRAILYFIVWWTLILVLNRWSKIQDSPPDRFLGRRLAGLSGAGMVAYFWTMTFASVDWLMSLNPGWPSTIYAFIVIVGQGLTGFCFVVLVGKYLRLYEPMNVLMSPRFFHDIGKLMITFVMLWAYMSFSQWLIIWAGDMPDEIRWFVDRSRGGWEAICLLLMLGHFAVPFALLLSRSLKKNANKLAWVAGWLILMRYVDLYWNIEPNYWKAHFHFSWMDAVIPIAMSALWVGFFAINYASRPVAALHDPKLRALLAEEAVHG